MKGNFHEIISSSTPVLVDFFAEWCQPCKIQTPILQEVAREMTDKVRIIKIDIDKNPLIASQYQVQGVPTLALFKEGRVLWREAGVQAKHQIINIINSNI